MDESSAIMWSLSFLGGSIVSCLAVIIIICTAILINKLLRKYWEPIELIRYHDVHTEFHEDLQVQNVKIQNRK